MRINVPVTPGIEAYIDHVGYREHHVLAACRAEAAMRGEMAVMQIAPEQGALLQVLVRAIGARRVLELGTFTGYSAMAIALALPAGGSIVSCDNDVEIVETARRFWEAGGVSEKIDLRLGDAAATLHHLLQAERGMFDLVLIDADKPNYAAYVELAADLVRPGGLLVIDDTLLHGRVATGRLSTDPEFVEQALAGVRAANEYMANDARFTFALLPTRDGLTIAVRN